MKFGIYMAIFINIASFIIAFSSSSSLIMANNLLQQCQTCRIREAKQKQRIHTSLAAAPGFDFGTIFEKLDVVAASRAAEAVVVVLVAEEGVLHTMKLLSNVYGSRTGFHLCRHRRHFLPTTCVGVRLSLMLPSSATS